MNRMRLINLFSSHFASKCPSSYFIPNGEMVNGSLGGEPGPAFYAVTHHSALLNCGQVLLCRARCSGTTNKVVMFLRKTCAWFIFLLVRSHLLPRYSFLQKKKEKKTESHLYFIHPLFFSACLEISGFSKVQRCCEI